MMTKTQGLTVTTHFRLLDKHEEAAPVPVREPSTRVMWQIWLFILGMLTVLGFAWYGVWKTCAALWQWWGGQ